MKKQHEVYSDHPEMAALLAVRNWLEKKIIEVNYDIVKTIEELAVEKEQAK